MEVGATMTRNQRQEALARAYVQAVAAQAGLSFTPRATDYGIDLSLYAMNNWDKWIDPRVRQVKPADIQRYLLARGWRPISSPRRQLLFFEEPRGHQGKPVTQTVPASDGGSDYLDAVVRVITNLAALEDRFAGDEW